MEIKKFRSAEEVAKYREENERQLFNSRFSFLNEHKGLRKPYSHGLIGTSGSGKSAVVKAIIADTAETTKVFCYLTEETVIEYQLDLEELGARMDNIVFLEERDIEFKNYANKRSIIDSMFEKIVENNCEVLFFDNLTTSKLYEPLKPHLQGELFQHIQNKCLVSDVGFFYVGHTKQGISDNHRALIDGEDMRGSSYPFMLSQYFYILQRFITKEGKYPFIHLRKHRGHKIENSYFLLNYKEGLYYDDRKTDFSIINQYYKERNYLGKTNGDSFKKSQNKVP